MEEKVPVSQRMNHPKITINLPSYSVLYDREPKTPFGKLKVKDERIERPTLETMPLEIRCKIIRYLTP